MNHPDKYKHSVLDVANMLACWKSGTWDDLSYEEMRAYRAWLEWRITPEGWYVEGLPGFARYDHLVFCLANQALELTKDAPWNIKNHPVKKADPVVAASREAIDEAARDLKVTLMSAKELRSLEDHKVADYHKRVQVIRTKMIEVERKLVAMVTDFHSIAYSKTDSHTWRIQIFPLTSPTDKSGLWEGELPLSQWNAYTLLKVAAALPSILEMVKKKNAEQTECYQRLEAAEKGLSQL